MNPFTHNQNQSCYPVIITQCPAATSLQLPPSHALIEGAGKLTSANLQATALATQSLQGKDVSVTAEIFNRERGIMEKRHVGISYELEKDGTKTPELFEVIGGKRVELKATPLFYADGKLYGANGELKGDFAFDRTTDPAFLRAAVIQGGGEFREKNTGRIIRFNQAEMKLDDERVLIVNAPPPNLVKSIRAFDGPTLEDQKHNPDGLFGNSDKNVKCEVAWVTPEAQKRAQSALPTSQEIDAEIAKKSTTSIREGRWKLADGTIVGKDGQSTFIIKEKVLPTTMKAWGSNIFEMGRTGVDERIYLSSDRSAEPLSQKPGTIAPPPVMPPAEASKQAEQQAKPMEPKSKSAEPEAKPVEPMPKPVEPKSSAPSAKPAAPPMKAAEPTTRAEPAPKSAEPETKPTAPEQSVARIQFNDTLLNHQARHLQHVHAKVMALIATISDPKFEAAPILDFDSAAVRKSPQAELKRVLEEKVLMPLLVSDELLCKDHLKELAGARIQRSSYTIDLAIAQSSSVADAVGSETNPVIRLELLKMLAGTLGTANSGVPREHRRKGFDSKKPVLIDAVELDELKRLEGIDSKGEVEQINLRQNTIVDERNKLIALGYGK